MLFRSVALWNGDIKQWEEKIKALPMVTETLPPSYFPIIPTAVSYTHLDVYKRQDVCRRLLEGEYRR